jgi:outer membrane lipoprotein SlyB
LAIPGIGPIVAAGPIAGALTGAVTGGVAGGLVDWGLPEQRGRHYENRLREGNILALVKADGRRVDRAARILRDNGAQEVESHNTR